jgi:hypothetical protein
MKKKKRKVTCNYCKKSKGKIKFYVISDDLENPRPYHEMCYEKFTLLVIAKLSRMELLEEEIDKIHKSIQ